MKIITVCFFILLIARLTVNAQIKIGLPIGLADSSTVLDLGSKGGSFNKGVLLPRVNLSSTLVWGLLGTAVTDGMIVYNRIAAGTGATAVIPGVYFWAGGKWSLLAQANIATASITNCGSAALTPLPFSGGILNNGSAYSATYTLNYPSGSGAAYNAVAQSVSGLTLSRAAGSFAAGGGTLVYNLSGTYTGITNATIAFNINECNNTINYGSTGTADNVRAALSSSIATYDAATAGNWVNVTAAEYSYAQTTVTGSAIIGATNGNMATSSNIAWTSGNNITNATVALATNNYLYGFSFRTGSNISGSSTATSLSIGASGTNLSGNYTNFPAGVSIPALSLVSANTLYYFLLKNQTTIVGSIQYLSVFNATSLLGNITDGSNTYYGTIVGTIPNASSNIPSNTPGNTLIQFLATPTRQW